MLDFKPVARYLTNDVLGEVWVDLETYDQCEAVRRAPVNAHSFNIFEQPIYVGARLSDIEESLAIYGMARRMSTTYWLGGQVYCLADISRRPRLNWVADAMRKLGVVKMIHTRLNTWEPFGDLDILITGVNYAFA